MSQQTEQSYADRMFDLLRQGRLMRLLRIEAQANLSERLLERQFEQPFAIVFRLSENRQRDVALWCVCLIDLEAEDGESIIVNHALPGMSDAIPKEAHGLDTFEVNLRDMEPEI